MVKKLACPECGGTQFELIIKNLDESFDKGEIIEGTDLLMNTVEICVSCGWKAKPDDPKEVRRRLSIMLELATYKQPYQEQKRVELVDWEGFKLI